MGCLAFMVRAKRKGAGSLAFRIRAEKERLDCLVLMVRAERKCAGSLAFMVRAEKEGAGPQPGHVQRFCVILVVGLSLHRSQLF